MPGFRGAQVLHQILVWRNLPKLKIHMAGEVSPQLIMIQNCEWMQFCYWACVLLFFSVIGSSKLNKNEFWYEFSFVMFSHWSDAEYWILHIIAVLWVCHFTKKQSVWKKKKHHRIFPNSFDIKQTTSTLAPGHVLAVSLGSRVPHLLVEKPQPQRWRQKNMTKTYPFFPWAKRTHINIDLPVFIFLLIVTLVLVYQIYNRMHLDLTWKNYRSFSPLESQVTNVYTCHHL